MPGAAFVVSAFASRSWVVALLAIEVRPVWGVPCWFVVW